MNTVNIGSIAVGGQHPIVLLAGPCVIEGLERTLKIGRGIKEITIVLVFHIFLKHLLIKPTVHLIPLFADQVVEGLKIINQIKQELGVPVVSDIHCVTQIAPAAEVLDILQIPAFLCRQTDLLYQAGRTGKVVNVKKGQFLAPNDMQHVIAKIREAGNENILLTERGASFGYNNLVTDMRSLAIMRSFGYPIVFDATHSVQLPGGAGATSSGQREFVPCLTRAAVATGIDALFMEVHDNPAEALSDGPNMMYLDQLEALLKDVQAIDNVVRKHR